MRQLDTRLIEAEKKINGQLSDNLETFLNLDDATIKYSGGNDYSNYSMLELRRLVKERRLVIINYHKNNHTPENKKELLEFFEQYNDKIKQILGL